MAGNVGFHFPGFRLSLFSQCMRANMRYERIQQTNRLFRNQCCRRQQSTDAKLPTTSLSKDATTSTQQAPSSVVLPPHSMLPTKMLLRSLLVSAVSSKPFLLGPALKALTFLTHTKMSLFNVDRNPVLHAFLKKTFYEHFCAGENGNEVRSTITSIKDMGFRGVILTYAKEIVTDPNTKEEKGSGLEIVQNQPKDAIAYKDSDIESWRLGVLETVEMVGQDDFLALKFTGAGPKITAALSEKTQLPEQMTAALDQICQRAIERNVRILVDAEQQSVQPSIDNIAMSLMKQYNTNGAAVVYNTYQAYLKCTPGVLDSHLHQATKEGFSLGVKLVRGAYMKSEPRELINDTKEDTDNSYNSIATGLLQQDYAGLTSRGNKNENFPPVNLFLGTHNKESSLLAQKLFQERVAAGKPTVPLQTGQLLGMADEVSCMLLQMRQNASKDTAPQVYKCLSWGTLNDCLSYLLRRAVENRDAVGRTKAEYTTIKVELWRRFKRVLLMRKASAS